MEKLPSKKAKVTDEITEMRNIFAKELKDLELQYLSNAQNSKESWEAMVSPLVTEKLGVEKQKTFGIFGL